MKIHIVTVGSPKLPYAKAGWDEYLNRLKHYHSVKVTHIADKQNTSSNILSVAGSAYKIALVIDGPQNSSPELAIFLNKQALSGKEICFLVGGPEGLQNDVIATCDKQWGFSKLTFPHDLAMVILLESLYRASTINDGLPYHR
jgi:23S rRNA (pseudouridine1915-N3)-methyltransferase